MSNHNIEHLIFKTDFCDLEVKHCDFDAHLWSEVRFSELGGHVESKVSAELDLLITNLDSPHTSFFLDLFTHKWLNNWVKGLIAILQDYWISERHTVLKDSCLHFDVHGWLDDLKLVFLLHLLDPSVTLHLRVNHKRPSIRVIHDDSIVYSKLLLRKFLNEPSLDLDSISKNLLETEGRSTLDLERFHELHPFLESLLSVFKTEYSEVSNDTR
jgi:hypothetical protein